MDVLSVFDAEEPGIPRVLVIALKDIRLSKLHTPKLTWGVRQHVMLAVRRTSSTGDGCLVLGHPGCPLDIAGMSINICIVIEYF